MSVETFTDFSALDIDDDLPTAPKAPTLAKENVARGVEAFVRWAQDASAEAVAMGTRIGADAVAQFFARAYSLRQLAADDLVLVVAAQQPAVAPSEPIPPPPVRVSNALHARYQFLNAHGIQMQSMSTDQDVVRYLPKLRALVAQLDAQAATGNTEAKLRADDLRSVMRRVPEGRQDGKKYVTGPSTPAPVATLEQLAATPGVDAATYGAQPGETHHLVAQQPKQGHYLGVAEGDETTGKLLDWERSGEVRMGALREQWLAQGLDESLMPKAARPATVLRRAAKELQKRHVLVRQNLKHGGWEVVVEGVKSDDSGRNEYTPIARVFLDPEDGSVDVEAEDAHSAEAALICERVALEYKRQLDEEIIDAERFGSWLVKLAYRHLGAVSYRRRSGGVYYVPPTSKVELTKIAKAIHACSSHIINDQVDMIKSAGLAAKAIAGLVDEASTLFVGIEAKLGDDDMGPRAARSRLDDLDRLATKIERYEGLFTCDMAPAKVKITALREQLKQKTSRIGQLEVG